MITTACRECVDWMEKNILYAEAVAMISYMHTLLKRL
jgi:hypothetical protein